MTHKVGRLLGALLMSAVALAGCAVVHAPGTGSTSRVITTPASSAAPTSQPPKQRAEVDAAAILAAFVVPPGAQKLPGLPSVLKKEVWLYSESPNLIDKVGFWQAKGDPQQVLAWMGSHQGPGHTTSQQWANGPFPHRVTTYFESYTFPPFPAVEDTRMLYVEVADAGNGETAIRVDANVTWLPPHTASEMVPAAATAITLSVIPNGNLNKKPPQPVTITSPAAVHRIIAMVNSLPVFPPGPRECGVNQGAELVLTFLAAPRGRVLATALVQTGYCEEVFFTVGTSKITNDTRTQYARGVVGLGVPYQGHVLAGTVLKTAGSKWNLAAYSF